MLKAREGIQFSRDEDHTSETLMAKFNSYCPVQNIPYEQNPFYTCVERAGLPPPPSSRVERFGREQNYVNKKSNLRLAEVEESGALIKHQGGYFSDCLLSACNR